VNPLREDIRTLLRVDNRDGGFSAELVVDENLRILPDHFPGQPILPGICMVQAVLLGGAARHGLVDLHLRALKNMKLTQPVRPGTKIFIDADMTRSPDGGWAIKARLSACGRRCAEISLIASEGEAT
jgi:3-hydroxymyristoyl/3-hydroxydecanoyl-(acyl carrier protein) dehydratase